MCGMKKEKRMPKTKSGEQISWKEFGVRWKKGINGITPLQQANIQIKGTYIIILGLCSGIFITCLNIKDLWWLTLILVGGLFNSAMQWVGLYQKKNILKKLYDDSEPEFDKGIDMVCSNEESIFEEDKLKNSEKEVDLK